MPSLAEMRYSSRCPLWIAESAALEKVEGVPIAPLRQAFPNVQTRMLDAGQPFGALKMSPTSIRHMYADYLGTAHGTRLTISPALLLLLIKKNPALAHPRGAPRWKLSIMGPPLYPSASHRASDCCPNPGYSALVLALLMSLRSHRHLTLFKLVTDETARPVARTSSLRG